MIFCGRSIGITDTTLSDQLRDSPCNKSVTSLSRRSEGGYLRVKAMPRLPRYHLPDGVYHVTTLGVAGTMIFVDDEDRKYFVRLLATVADRFGWRVHAWCQMETHYHLVVSTTRDRLSAGMQRLNGLYAQRFNRRYGRRGHLFGDRFAAWMVETREHLESAIEYVLTNPVKAGMCKDVRDWVWSWPRLYGRAPPGDSPRDVSA